MKAIRKDTLPTSIIACKHCLLEKLRGSHQNKRKKTSTYKENGTVIRAQLGAPTCHPPTGDRHCQNSFLDDIERTCAQSDWVIS